MDKIKTFFQKDNLKSWIKNDAKTWLMENAKILISITGLLFCVIFFTVASDGKLWSPFALKGMIRQFAPYFVIALGAVFIYSMGYMDISLGAQLGVFAILTISILNKTGSLLLGFVVSLAIALFCGWLNGTVSVFLKLPSIVTSIFISSIFGGLQLLLVQNLTITPDKPQGQSIIQADGKYSNIFDTFKDPWVIIAIMVVFALIATFLFSFTKIGKYTKSIGANETVAKQCGVNTTLWKTLGYAALAVAITVAAVLFIVPKTGSASKETGQGLAMEIMLCLILGSMPLSGGMKSRMSCALIGALIYVILDWGLNICFSELANFKYVINALMFIVVVVLTSRQKASCLPR